MRIVGLPETFWVVTSPSPVSELGDICFECDFVRFARQVRGGLNEQEIVGVFANQQPAVELAEKLLASIHSITSGTNADIMVLPKYVKPTEHRLMSEYRKEDQPMTFSVLTDEAFLEMVAKKGNPDELNQAMLALRREGKVQLFDDGSGDPLIVKVEQTN